MKQGWENLNSSIKKSYNHNIQKGGGRGGSSKLLPVMQMAAIAMLWRFGYLDSLFSYLGFDGKLRIEYGKVLPIPKNNGSSGIDQELVELFAKTVLDLAPQHEINSVLYGLLEDCDNG